MKYLEFGCSTEPSVIGEYPQCSLKKGVDLWAENGYTMVRWNEFPDFVPYVELVLNSKAKWTDILSSVVGHGFIINNRVKSILEGHNLPARAFYPVKVHSGDSSRDYYWFHYINNDFWDWVDQDRSKLFLRHLFPDKRSQVLGEADLSLSTEGLVDLSRNKPRLTDYYWEKLVLNNNFPDLDFFRTLFPSRHTVISQRLLNAFEESGITGYETKDFCEVVN